jgi:hypothetical protein
MVLIAGGISPTGIESSAELYNPITGLFSVVGPMTTPRSNFTATLLDSTTGRVLMAGGDSSLPPPPSLPWSLSTNTAEIFDPATGTFAPTGGNLASFPVPSNTPLGRAYHTATLLSNGKVLIAGGMGDGYPDGTKPTFEELFDPTLNNGTGGFTPTAVMVYPRIFNTATALNNGKVLIAGGGPTFGGFLLPFNELFDPNGLAGAGSFGLNGSLLTARLNPMAVLLLNGNVLILGGEDDNFNNITVAEIYQTVP